MIGVEVLADIIFNLIPEDIQKKYEKEILGKTLTLKDKFICYCEVTGKCPRYSKEESKERASEILKNPNLYKSDSFNLLIFNPLLRNLFLDSTYP